MNASDGLILGIDGGGTKTVAWLARCDFTNKSDVTNTMEIIGRGRSGSSNVRGVGFETALDHLNQAVERAFADAELSRVTVESACLALAGAGREVEQQRIRSWADQCQLTSQLTVVDDALPVLYAASSEGIKFHTRLYERQFAPTMDADHPHNCTNACWIIMESRRPVN